MGGKRWGRRRLGTEGGKEEKTARKVGKESGKRGKATGENLGWRDLGPERFEAGFGNPSRRSGIRGSIPAPGRLRTRSHLELMIWGVTEV